MANKRLFSQLPHSRPSHNHGTFGKAVSDALVPAGTDARTTTPVFASPSSSVSRLPRQCSRTDSVWAAQKPNQHNDSEDETA